jgi:hypothetical protein
MSARHFVCKTYLSRYIGIRINGFDLRQDNENELKRGVIYNVVFEITGRNSK